MGHNYFSQLDVFITLTDLTPMFQSCVIKTLHMTVLFEHQRNIVSVLWAIFVIKGLQFLQILGMDGIDLFLGRSVNFLQLDWFANYNWTFYFKIIDSAAKKNDRLTYNCDGLPTWENTNKLEFLYILH